MGDAIAMWLLCVCSVIVGVLGLVGCGDDESERAASQGNPEAAAVTFALHEENHSGHNGKASLEAAEATASVPGGGKHDGMRVTITISPDTGAGNPAHIHDVTCAQYRAMGSFDEQLATVEDGLSALDHGRSETVITTELGARTNGHYSINVHKPAHPYDVIACGDIPRR
jgi:hypothetical protein